MFENREEQSLTRVMGKTGGKKKLIPAHHLVISTLQLMSELLQHQELKLWAGEAALLS